MANCLDFIEAWDQGFDTVSHPPCTQRPASNFFSFTEPSRPSIVPLLLHKPQVIGERGAQLSGGQRARLALARAILRDSRLLLLDEISAALDSVSEAALHSALERVLQVGAAPLGALCAGCDDNIALIPIHPPLSCVHKRDIHPGPHRHPHCAPLVLDPDRRPRGRPRQRGA